MNIANDCVVSLHYTLTNDQGEELDSSAGKEPLQYLHGASGIIAGLEQALSGRAVGDHFTVVIQPEEAYGDINPELIQQVPIDAFANIEGLEAGMQLQAQDPDGNVQLIHVQDVSDGVVTVNGNHPLAGQVLHFDVTVDAVRAATAEELDHGHVH